MMYVTCAVQARDTGRFLFIQTSDSKKWAWPGTNDVYESKQCFDSVKGLIGHDDDYNAFVCGRPGNHSSILHRWVEREFDTIISVDHIWCHLGEFPNHLHPSVGIAMRDQIFLHHCLDPY